MRGRRIFSSIPAGMIGREDLGLGAGWFPLGVGLEVESEVGADCVGSGVFDLFSFPLIASR